MAKEVTSKRKTPKSVNAACNCYSQIYKFLRLNVDLAKLDKPRTKKVAGE